MSKNRTLCAGILCLGLVAFLAADVAMGAPCVVPDNGSGTVNLPPLGGPGCGYLSPTDVHEIIAGLPPGTTILLGAAHSRFGNIITTPGGPLGGEREQFTSEIFLELHGTGDLAGFNRLVNMVNINVVTDTAPRGTGTPQSFATDMFGMQGQLPPGDPDFDLLRITAGSGFGMPSPGHTTLTRLGPPGSNWQVDSFFDVFYRIDFIGAPGGPLAGHSGSTTGTIRMQTGVGGSGPTGCCLPMGMCVMTSSVAACLAQSGSPLAPGMACGGDLNGDGIDEACFSPPCVECGPGPHWIDNPGCPPGGSGMDTLPSGAVLGIDTNFDCVADTNVVAFGPVSIRQRGPFDDASNFPGTRPIDGHLDVIDTEIIGMSLMGGGVTLKAGTAAGTMQPLNPTLGAVAEQPGNPNLADSFFDVFFEIEYAPGLFAYNQTPIQVAQIIDCMPPKDIYYHLGGCKPLFSSPNPGAGVPVANLVQANHFTYPACCSTALPGGCAPNVPASQCQGTVVPACLGDADGNGQDDACDPKCERDATSLTGCSPTCPPPVGTSDQCLPKTAGCNPNEPGSCGVLSCECQDSNVCHLEKDPATGAYTCIGGCPVPPGGTCTLLGDGAFDNPFRCDCVGTPACVPNADASDCEQSMCPGPIPPTDLCQKKCVKIDAAGNIEVTDCECEPATNCHVETSSTLPRGTEGGVAGGAGGCVLPDNGNGTVDLPPLDVDCGYLSPDDVHMIINGLPPGTTIQLGAQHHRFGNVITTPGGPLGGEVEQFNSEILMVLEGTGDLVGFNRIANMMNVAVETHTAPRGGGSVQSFDTQMFAMQGQLPPGDPDFDLLRITAGGSFGMPSPGHTTLTQLPGGGWAVDSFFDITYRIDFVGAPGGPLGGMSGSTTGTIRMQTNAPIKCTGDCPVGTVCEQTNVPQPDGTNKICCDCVAVPTVCEPNSTGTDCNPVACPPDQQGLSQVCRKKCVKVNAIGIVEVVDCDCQPDQDCYMDLLSTGGRDGGMAEFEGGVAGGPNGCIVPDDGSGSVDLPPVGCDYLSPDEVHMIIDGLPAGTTINLAPIHRDFICNKQQGGVCSFPAGVDCEENGGSLGGEKECSDSTLHFNAQCTGPGCNGFGPRAIDIPLSFETHVGPRVLGDPVQSFDTDMFRMFGQITGDPDFDLLRVVGGTDFGLPSPGHTTLTQLPGGNWAVDSFFDITYRIDFVGSPGGPLGGMSGSTTGTIRMQTGAPFKCRGNCPAGTQCLQTSTPEPDGTNKICCECVTIPPPVCEALSDASGCTTTCPPPVGFEQCLPLTGGCNPNQPGTCGILSCDCQDPNVCHLVRDAAGYHCEGGCPVPPGGNCTLMGTGGFGDPYHCECAPPPDCAPNSSGTDCNPVLCPPDPLGLPQVCRKKCVKVDADGNVQVVDCDCQQDQACYMELSTTGGREADSEVEGGVAGGPNDCIVPDNGGGTVTLPPAGCDYLSPSEVHMILDGLPPNTTLELQPIHLGIFCREQNNVCSFPPGVDCTDAGGALGGEKECNASQLQFQLACVPTGPGGCPGALSGWTRPVMLPDVGFETHVAPRTPGDPVQSFDTQMFRLFGQITNPSSGDPDFDLLRVVAGNDFGLPSPGHTTLTQLPGGNWAVDSFFDITYRIDFVGRSGGHLGGMSGSTTGTIRMQTGAPFKCRGDCPPGTQCLQTSMPEPDGTKRICCECVDVEPEGACCTTGATGTICVNTTQSQCNGTFLPGQLCSGIIVACCLPGGACQQMDEVCCAAAGGSSIVGGTCTGPQACCFTSGACQFLDPVCCQAQSGTPGGAGSDCIDGDGNGVADDCERCEPTSDGTGCTNSCPPNPVQNTCHQRCARFDPQTQQITITDCDCRGSSACHLIYPGGGAGARDAEGEDVGVIAGGADGCVVPDNGSGTVTLPPPGCDYLSPSQVHMIIDGLPPGTTLNLMPIHSQIFCREQNNVCSFPPGVDCTDSGGALGGEKECNGSMLQFQATCSGTCPGGLAGFNRTITLPNVGFETHTAPHTPGQASQSFDTQMFRLFGQLPPGDPDFDLLRITAGNDFGLPSPGHTTLTRLGPPGSSFAVDSFFDITYRIDFVGSPTGPLAGMSGSTTATIRMATKAPFKCVGACGVRRSCTPMGHSNIDGTITVCCDCRPRRPLADPTLVNKARFVSFSIDTGTMAGGGSEENAIRVRLVSLHHVNPPYQGGPSIPFTAFEGQVRYAGPPAVFLESFGGDTRFVASQLTCSPHYRDWTSFNSCSLTPTLCSTDPDCPMGGTCTVPVGSLLHLTGSAVTPSSTYEVEVLGSSCMGTEDDCEDISDPLEMKTSRWADVEIPYNPPSTTLQPDLADVAALINKFRNAPGAPIKARALLLGGDLFGEIDIATEFSFIHIAACVDAFRGRPYPHEIQSCP